MNPDQPAPAPDLAAHSEVTRLVRRLIDFGKGGSDAELDELSLGQVADLVIAAARPPVPPQGALVDALRKCRVEDAPAPLFAEHDLTHIAVTIAPVVARLVAETWDEGADAALAVIADRLGTGGGA